MDSLLQKSLFLFLALCCLTQYTNAHPLKICKLDQIYQLGDSISDTGNFIRQIPIETASAFARLSYGETIFNNATGRCSNGLLIIDHIAMAAGLPFVRPYKNMDGHFKHGVNFAVAGSTALPSQVLASKHIFCPVTTTSLHVQLEWMFTHFNSICFDHTDCVDKLENALFMVGEIGGNDYNYAFSKEKQWRIFQSNISEAYDENQCLNQFNEFAQYHNEQLQQAIFKLQQEKPNAIVVYGDYYNAYQFLLKFATHHGLETQRACCGTGGKYNFDLKRMCGEDGDVPVCAEPNRYVSWDGVHLTQRGYKIMAAWLLHDIFPKLHCHF
ncbi:hypothetical protein DH2020_016962 [Rehmannia glutinosa]|uniref:Acetylajmalan esterase-like n=1 Tax=Rehmannia glutinosa TaxID=99300 RepID=A0ABR0WPR5_REHGL